MFFRWRVYEHPVRPGKWIKLWPMDYRGDGCSWFVPVKTWFGPIYKEVGAPILIPNDRMERI